VLAPSVKGPRGEIGEGEGWGVHGGGDGETMGQSDGETGRLGSAMQRGKGHDVGGLRQGVEGAGDSGGELGDAVQIDLGGFDAVQPTSEASM
jgi:hypothetical protein